MRRIRFRLFGPALCLHLVLASSTLYGITRDSVMNTASHYATWYWYCSSLNANSYWNDYTPDTWNTGVSYNWGGMDSLSDFQTKINEGRIAGTNQAISPPRYDFAGIDCSGFVLRCWGFTTHTYSTSTLYLISNQILWTDLRKGDILNWAGHHVRLFERYDDVDPNKIWVFEATAGVTPARVVYRYVYKSDMVASYVPRRYVSIQEMTAADLDHDGDVDLDDFGILQACFNGPNRPPAAANCDGADFDDDSDVDLNDFGHFQGCFNGPNRPARCQG